MNGEPFWVVLAGVLAWPIGAVVLVLLALLLTPAPQRAEVLRAVADVVRAARGTSEQPPQPAPAVQPVPPAPPAVPTPRGPATSDAAGDDRTRQVDGGGARGSPP